MNFGWDTSAKTRRSWLRYTIPTQWWKLQFCPLHSIWQVEDGKSHVFVESTGYFKISLHSNPIHRLSSFALQIWNVGFFCTLYILFLYIIHFIFLKFVVYTNTCLPFTLKIAPILSHCYFWRVTLSCSLEPQLGFLHFAFTYSFWGGFIFCWCSLGHYTKAAATWTHWEEGCGPVSHLTFITCGNRCC